MAVMQLLLLNEFVNHSRISQLQYITDKTGYLLTLDFFHFVNRQQRCSVRFDLHVWTDVLKNIGDSKTFFRANWTFKNKMLKGRRAFILKT